MVSDNESPSGCWVEGPSGRPKTDDEYFERMTHMRVGA